MKGFRPNIIFFCIYFFVFGSGCQDQEICPEGLSICSGECVDLASDHENCGSCGNACDPGESCVSGKCSCGGAGPDCGSGETCCGASCVDTQEDGSNCGVCGTVCDAGETCGTGDCRCGGIGTDCDAMETCCSTSCVDLQMDESNCGGCGMSCDAGEICVSGSCSCGGTDPDCTGRWICCDGSCRDSMIDENYCGDCLSVCGANEECLFGYCQDLGWVHIPGGTFMMGSPDGVGESDEHPQHQVTVPDIEILRTEVTMLQYRYCVDSGACTEPFSPGDCDWCDRCNWTVPGRDDHPVVCVDWHQAVDFCAYIGGRLPTEAEWEYAARSGGQDIAYPWGNQESTCDYAVMSDQFGGGYGCGLWHEWPVCSKPAGNTVQGLCDMAGNAWEMVQDRYHDNYTGAPTDGSAWESPPGYASVMRGGGWDYLSDDLRASNRLGGNPDGRYDSLGFRCARDAVP